MARKRTNKQNLSDIVETYGRQLIVGSIALIAIVAFLSTRIFNEKPKITPDYTPRVSSIPTPIKTQDAARGALTNPVINPVPKLVTKLPLTAGETIFYTVKSGDNIAKLGETFCGDKRAWIEIADDNKIYSPYTIQPGDTLKISCPR